MMYRIEKVLNHNTVIAIHQDDHKEVLIMGKGVGFGRKVAERIKVRPEDRLYSLQKYKERGGAKEIVKSIAPEFLELTNAVLNEAEKVFGKIDRMVLFPLADHIAFAVKRIQNHEQISNPLTEDIRVLFHMEFKVAESIRPLLKKQFQIVSSLLNRPDVTCIYVCTDSGREGEYIYRLVAQMAGVRGKVQKRVWIDSQTEEEILRGIREAKDLSEYNNLSDAAYRIN